MPNKKWWSRYETGKGCIVFPFAIVWEERDPLYNNYVSKLSIHFLWWHWGLWFERGRRYG